MKNTILTLLLTLIVSTAMTANEQDTLWYRYIGHDVYDVDFTPDDKHVIAWTKNLEFWNTETGLLDFIIPNIKIGDLNYNNEYIVFSQDSTPKLLDWQTREIIEDFETENSDFEIIKTAKSKNEFMADLDDDKNTIYFWDAETKQKTDSLNLVKIFEKGYYKWKKTIHEYGYIGENDEAIYVIIDDVNDEIEHIEPDERRRIYYMNFYNRETKELVDSIYSFTNTNEKFGGANQIAVLNERNKVALNNEGGLINFYNFNNYAFEKYSEYGFSSGEYADLEFSENDEYMIIAYGETIKVLDMATFSELSRFTVGTYYECDISNNKEMVVGNIGGGLFLHPNILTNVQESNNVNPSIIYPNPSSSNLTIKLITEKVGFFNYRFYNTNGEIVLSDEVGYLSKGENVINLNTESLLPQTYILQISSQWESIEFKLIKEN